MTTINIDQVYREYSAQIFGYINYALGNHHDAEEVTNDVFLKIARLQNKPETQFNDELSAFPTYLRTVTGSVLKDFIRTNHQDKYKAVSDFADADGNPFFEFTSPEKADKLMERKEVRARIEKAINNLKPHYREIARLRFAEELKYEEIALELNKSVGTVKGMVNRCREMLKTELNDLYKVQKTRKSSNVQEEVKA